VLTNVISGFISDCKGYSVPVATMRALRASRIFGLNHARNGLSANRAFSRQISSNAKGDPVFFLSHRHFLAKGLTAQQRAEIALAHYQREDEAFDDSYFHAVYCGTGLTLWEDTIEGVTYDIRLMLGNDVLYEGGLSLVFHGNGERICVMSFSSVPTKMFLPHFVSGEGEPPLKDTILFVTRKQLTGDREYQKAFNKAFDRTTPAHLCLGALEGFGLAQGYNYFIAIDPVVHPSYSEDKREHFKVAYTDFWESLSGRKVSPFGYLVDLPLKLTPLDDLDASKRKRALARRKHSETVRDSAREKIEPRLENGRRPEAPQGVSSGAASALMILLHSSVLFQSI
jgi:uncharacterized protein VirK/YbjX